MTKKIDYYEDFLRTVEIREKDARKRRQKKLIFSTSILVVYLLVGGLFLVQSKNISILSFFRTDKDQPIKELDARLKNLEIKINNLKNPSQNNSSLNSLNSRIIAIEQKNSYLYETILLNPDSAITPKILREEQLNINEKIQDLKSQVDKTNTLLSGIFITLLIAIGGYIVKQIWGTFSRRDIAKE
ncbi:MAG: hypothetical protein Q8O88_05575 [bacterium]|nr:hypothetical protein [bacterium]